VKETRYFYVPNASLLSELPAEEASHAVRVLRMKEGDELFLMDGQGVFHRAEVTLATQKHCQYHILESVPQQRYWNIPITLAIAPTKMMERMEWLAEKATEIGFDRLQFLDCRFSERRQLRTDRIEKIVISAMKQSRKAWLPQVLPLEPFKSFVDNSRHGLRCIAHCYDEVPRHDLYSLLQEYVQSDQASHNSIDASPASVTILVGPEGDFSIDEVRYALDHGFQSVSLGQARLRTETAGLVSVMTAQMVQQHPLSVTQPCPAAQ